MFLVAGAHRLGKTSLLQQVPAHLPGGFPPIHLGLAEEPAKRLDWLLWRLASAISGQAGQLPGADHAEPAWSDFEGHTERFLDGFWPQVRARLGDRCLVLLLDDLDRLSSEAPDLQGSFLAFLAQWRVRDANVALIATAGSTSVERLAREHTQLFAAALHYSLGPLSSEEAIQLITVPVEGILTYDLGVPRRLVELTSGQPYYVQLLCFEIFARCALAGWVNQRDVDLVVEDFLGREIGEFKKIWDESSPYEQATLAALVSLRGARGVATVREVEGILTKAGGRLRREQIEGALGQLVAREILERLGALSYRFRLGLLRDWLGMRLDLPEVVRNTRWASPSRGKPAAEPRIAKLQPQQARRGGRPPSRPEAAESETSEPLPKRPRFLRWLWIGAVALLGLSMLAVLGSGLLRPGGVAPGTTPTPDSSATAYATRPALTSPTGAAPRLATTRPLASATTPLPSTTPSPTAPVILARPVPAIAYVSRPGKEMPWTIYLMTADGTNRTPLIQAASDFLSAPTWSPDGLQIAFVSDEDGNADVWTVGIDGRDPQNLSRNRAKENSPAWSPDGQSIAFSSVRDSLYWEIYVMNTDGSAVKRLTWWDDASDLSPSWSPDGKSLAFATKRDGNWEIYIMKKDGSELQRLTDNPAEDKNPAWSPDGSRIAFQSNRGGYFDIYVVPAAGGEEENLTNLRWATDLGPTWSPDGGRIAFYSDRDGEWDIYVMAADGSDVVKLTDDTTDDQLPAWRP